MMQHQTAPTAAEKRQIIAELFGRPARVDLGFFKRTRFDRRSYLKLVARAERRREQDRLAEVELRKTKLNANTSPVVPQCAAPDA